MTIKPLSLRLLTLSSVMLLALFSCKKDKKSKDIDPAFSQYILGFTSGYISKNSELTIRLAQASKKFTEPEAAIEEDWFDFSPSVEGKAYWVDNQTIVFRPEELLKSATQYDVTFNLGDVLDVERGFEEFDYQVQTPEQSFEVKIKGTKLYNENDLVWNSLTGSILSVDYLSEDEAVTLLRAEQDNKQLNIRWTHDPAGKYHHFIVDSVKRKDAVGTVLLEWSGEDIDVNVSGNKEFEIPSLSDFKMMSTTVVQSPEQYVLIRFSDPLGKNQDLEGLVRLQDASNLRYVIGENEVKVYTSSRQKGKKFLYLERGIKNVAGSNLGQAEKIELEFIEVKPAVRMVGNGVILPSTDGMVFPFEAVNLSAVDVKIVKIFENNIPQFLQVNRLNGASQLTRVGRPILKKKINLTSNSPIDYGTWNKFTLDLADLINEEPGAIYRVELGFRRAYSLYACDNEEGDDNITNIEEQWESYEDVESSQWDYYEDYYYDEYGYGYDYDWRQRDNPCNTAYYRQNRKVSRNIFASNIGLVAKGGKDKKILIIATDIRTTETLKGIEIEVYNFQNQKIKTGTTDQRGMLEVDLETKPFLLVARNGMERGYLKLDDGSSLSLSQFDVSGQRIQDGIKGYIYGERGVWRPGDTLFLNLVLEDKAKLLPKGHPVIFEMTNPLGQVTHRVIKNTGLNGFFNFTVATEPTAPTGNWAVKTKVGGATFTKIVKIEAIKPNRLKVNMDFGVDMLAVDRPAVQGEMKVTWLHGAAARNLRARVAVTLTQGTTRFDPYPGYVFTDPARRFSADEQVIFDSNIDGNGMANVSPNITVTDAAPGMLRANFVTRVFEESGDFSVDRFSIPYSPYSTYIGIKTPEGDRRGMLLTDTLHTIQLASVNPEGKPVSVSDLDVSIYKLHWRWWWDSSDEYLANYVGSSYKDWAQKFKAKTVNGKGSFAFKINKPDWGRYMIRVTDRKSGHSTGRIVYVDWPGWAGRGKRQNPGGASMLSFSSDKEQYTVGETAKISVPASGEGRALLTVESGSKILEALWLQVNADEITHEIPITSNMAPNAYVSVTMLQPHVHDNNLPIRLYGVIPIKVEDPGTHLEPVITMPGELAPETQVTIEVEEKEGKAMTYTVAMVDDGLLDLTRFKTPDPHPVFYAREALGVKTWDLYDHVIGAYGGQLERLLSVGGDEELEGSSKEDINRFKPMVRFLGPFELRSNGNNKHIIDIPNYIGSVRTMVIAGQDGAYGHAEKTTPVKKPLMVLATLPRVLGPAEKVKLPVTLFAMDSKIKNVQVRVEANELFKKGFIATQNVQFDQTGDKVINFELEVTDGIGKGEVTITASSGREKATYSIELEVRNPNPVTTDFVEALVEEGSTSTLNYQLFGVEGTNSATLELSNMPPIDFERRLKFLVEYPHGCIEQTTSKAFPQLYINDVMEVDNRVEARMSDNVKSALRKLSTFQHNDGGFSYWPNGTYSSDWASSYAGHFMLEAEAKGFTLPVGMKDKWVQYQKRTARNYSPITTTDSRGRHVNYRYDFAQSYRLYTLALAGKPEIGAMNRLKADNKMGATGIWRLAIAYHLAGQPDVGQQMIAGIDTYVPTKGNDSYTYGSQDRDNAMILEAMSVMNRKQEAITLAKQVSRSLSSSNWMSTQTTAYCLLAMVKFAGESGTSKEMKFRYDINGRKDNMTSTLPIKLIDVDVSSGKTGEVTITNQGEGVLFARMAISGKPTQGNETTGAQNLQMSVSYKLMNGNPLDPSRIEQGTDFMAEVTINHKNPNVRLKDMALTQVFPSGWEILNTRMDGVESVHNADRPDYQDIRDDRVLTYFDLNRYTTYNRPGHTKTFRVLLNAAYLGRYYLPAVLTESMYDNEIFARQAGQWVEVVRPGE